MSDCSNHPARYRARRFLRQDRRAKARRVHLSDPEANRLLAILDCRGEDAGLCLKLRQRQSRLDALPLLPPCAQPKASP